MVNLWKHQQDCIDKAKDLDEFALFFDMGTGKTRTTIELLRHKYNTHDRIRKTLILAPIIVLENWKAEFLKFSKITENEIAIIYGDKKKRLAGINSNAHIMIINFEALIIEEVFQALVKWRPEILVVDESHRLKNMSAKRTKRAVLLSDLCYVKYLLSGTPVLNSPGDIFAQFRILDGGKSFGKNFFLFRSQYFYDKNAGMPKLRYFPNWQIKPNALDKMNSIIYRKAMRVKKEDCLDLPPLVRQTIYVDMEPTQAKLYEQMKKDFITFVHTTRGVEASTATLAITKGLRLLQITSGFVRTEDGNEIALKETPKQKALKELLEELTPNHKVVIWATFRENYGQIRRICGELGLEAVEVHGEISGKQKFESVERFNNDERTRVLIGHPGSGGVGINLVSASYSIFYSRGFSLEFDLQAEARNYRGGSEIHERVTRLDLVCKDTIEVEVCNSLANKMEISEKVLRAWALE